jgi:MOB kinase activator 1
LNQSLKSECVNDNCPKMSAGSYIEYAWQDKETEKYKTPTSVPAPLYIKLLQDWIKKQVEIIEKFNDDNNSYPKNFSSIMKKIYTRMNRIFVHIYYTHFDEMKKKGTEAHLNTIFKHFMYFTFEFKLIEKQELKPLNDVIISLLGENYSKFLDIEKDLKKKSNFLTGIFKKN